MGPEIARQPGMIFAHIPSLAALDSNDDERLAADLRFGRLRSQAAAIRALADCVEHLTRAADADGLGEQLVEEMTRLGCRLLEFAGALVAAPPAEDSGTFARPQIGSAD